MSDVQLQNWAPYFNSGENFGSWFNSQLQQQQKLKFEQARAIIDDEFQRQRLGQQQQSTDQLGQYYKSLAQEASDRMKQTDAQQAETKRHNLATEAPDKEMTPADWQKMFLGYAGPTGGQMPIGSALDMMSATPGVIVSPEQRAAAMGSAAKVQGPSPVNMGMNIMGSLANSLGGVHGGPNLPTTEMQTPPPDQAFLPGTQEAMQKNEANIRRNNGLTAFRKWEQENGALRTKIQQDAAKAHIDAEKVRQQLDASKLKWADKLNQLKIDENDIRSYNAATYRWSQAIRNSATNSKEYGQAKDAAIMANGLIKAQLADVNKEIGVTQKEYDTNSKHMNLVEMEANALRGVVGDATEGQAYMQFLEKQSDHKASMQADIALKTKLDELKTQRTGLEKAGQDTLRLFSKQQENSGRQIPIPQAPGGRALPPPSGNNLPAPIKFGGNGPAKVGAPVITNKADFDKLPSGTIYMAPDGSRRRKP